MAPKIPVNVIPEISEVEKTNKPTKRYQNRIVWRNVIVMSMLHLAAIYGLYLCFVAAMWQTIAFGVFLYIISGLGITAGAHRLWSHRSYKAKWPLRVLLCFFNTMAYQNDIYEWSRDHRVHHKFTETDADPHNATRGFFFSHCGWLLVRKHSEVIEKGKGVDCSDILADPIVRFQKRNYKLLVLLTNVLIPIYVPSLFWGESKWNGFFIAGILRLVLSLNVTWLVNSAAHLWGQRPYDKHINPRENSIVVFGAIGEGFHNYHHTFPWDYSTSELGWRFNLTTCFINLMAWIGWAYDRKVVEPSVIRKRKERTGDGTFIQLF